MCQGTKLEPVRAAARSGAVKPSDQKAWAKRILARHQAGDRVTPISLRFAHQALGLAFDPNR
jgi:hypothetical protein